MLVYSCPSVTIRVARFLALFLTIALVYRTPVQAQVIIRDTVWLTPKKATPTVLRQSSNNTTTVRFWRGGTFRVTLVYPAIVLDTQPDGFGPFLNDVEMLPLIPVAWGSVHQWDNKSFFAYEIRQDFDPPSRTRFDLVPNERSETEMNPIAGGSMRMLFSRSPEADSTIWQAYAVEYVSLDSSEAMPPAALLSDEFGPGNPYDAELAPTLPIQFETRYRLIIEHVKPTAFNDLVLVSPSPQLLVKNVSAHRGDTLYLGPFPHGTELKLGLVSGVGNLVRGDTLYPRLTRDGILRWRFDFEDWTDLDFADLRVAVEPATGIPDHLELWSYDETIFYGDTVDVFITPVDADSLFAPLGVDEDYVFSVELTGDTEQYGELLYHGQSGTSFASVPSEGGYGVGVQFAANKREPDDVVELSFFLTAQFVGGPGGVARIAGGDNRVKIPPKARTMRSVVRLNPASKNMNQPSVRRSLTTLTPRVKKQERTRELPSEIAARIPSAQRPSPELSIQRAADIPFIEYMENEWTINSEARSILLGESKYYYAIEKNGKLIIHY
jgi:hypothetical protein